MRGYTAKVGLRRPQWSTIYTEADGEFVAIGRSSWAEIVATPDFARDPAFAWMDTKVSALHDFTGTIQLGILPLPVIPKGRMTLITSEPDEPP